MGIDFDTVNLTGEYGTIWSNSWRERGIIKKWQLIIFVVRNLPFNVYIVLQNVIFLYKPYKTDQTRTHKVL